VKSIKSTTFSVCLFTFIFFAANSSFSQQQTPVLDQLVQHFKDNYVLNANFQHQTIDSFTGDTTSNKGELWLTYNAYKVTTPTSNLLVKDSTSKVYDSLKNRLIISDYDSRDDDFAPSELLIDVRAEYDHISETSTGKFTTIKLISDDLFTTFKSITILLNSDNIPIKISAIDQTDNQITTKLLNPEFISFKSTFFQLNPPANAEIIDLR